MNTTENVAPVNGKKATTPQMTGPTVMTMTGVDLADRLMLVDIDVVVTMTAVQIVTLTTDVEITLPVGIDVLTVVMTVHVVIDAYRILMTITIEIMVA